MLYRSEGGLSSEIITTTTTETRARVTEVAQSQKAVTSSAGIVRKLIMSLMIVGNCRTRRKEKILTNRKIMKVMIPVRQLLLMVVLMANA